MRCESGAQANLEKAVAGIRQAAKAGAQLVCLQELFRSPYFCQTQDPKLFDLAESIPGVPTPLSGNVVVQPDPLPKFTATDRATRQALLMRIYDWTKALGNARVATRALIAQRDSIKADVGAPADSLNARITRLGTSVDRAFTAVNAQRGAIEGWSGLPTICGLSCTCRMC